MRYNGQKQKFMKKLLPICAALLIFSIAPQTAHARRSIQAFDTIEGFDSLVKIEGVEGGTNASITVVSPDNRRFETVVMADAEAFHSETIIPASFTALQGRYAVYSGYDSTFFEVYAAPRGSDFSTSVLSLADGVGGDERVLLAQASTAARFEIENIPASVIANERVHFRVTALDSNGAVVTGYRGTIAFSSTDANAQLPAAYTFLAEDQGRKTFDLGLSLRTVGVQQLKVYEQDNVLIKGEKTVEVTRTAAAATGAITITKPATGTYNVNILEIAGEAGPNSRVHLFDNGQKIAQLQANTSGRFSYTTSLLVDGRHSFQAESNGIQSALVPVTIDSTPAQIQDVEIAQTVLAPGATTEITVYSDPDLSAVQAAVRTVIVDLLPDQTQPGLYRGVLTAPTQEGEHTVTVFVTDRIGNVAPAQEVGKLRVDSSLISDGSFSFSVPTKVTGVQAIAGHAAALVRWSPAQAESGIAMYRIYYGTSPATISTLVNTSGPQTSFVVTGLQNGVEYFFQVVGIDRQGNEGDVRSEVVRATPDASKTLEGVSGGANAFGTDFDTGGPVLCDPGPCPPDVGYAPFTPEDGPEVWYMMVAAMLAPLVWKGFRKLGI